MLPSAVKSCSVSVRINGNAKELPEEVEGKIVGIKELFKWGASSDV